MSGFIWPTRVYYEDTDAGGVVYHANYLCFMERARSEWLRSFGIELDRMKSQYHVLFSVKTVKIDYIKPAVFNDLLGVTVEVESFRQASITFNQQTMRKVADKQELLANASVIVACVSTGTMKPVAIPPIITEKISHAI